MKRPRTVTCVMGSYLARGEIVWMHKMRLIIINRRLISSNNKYAHEYDLQEVAQ